MKLKILLLDDNPTYFYDREEEDIILPERLRDLFSISWLQNPAEAKAFYEWIEWEGLKPSNRFKEFGLPPDILIFDYALTSRFASSYPREEATSNIFKKIMDNCDRAMEFMANEIGGGAIREITGKSDTNDRVGLYLGVAIAKTFRAYPCGAVPTTGKAIVSNSDGAIFEWVNKSYFNNAFLYKERQVPSWDDLLIEGVRNFRSRFIKLAQANIISINEKNIKSIIAQKGSGENVLFFESFYGSHSLALKALFYDKSFNDFAQEASNWATQLWKSININ